MLMLFHIPRTCGHLVYPSSRSLLVVGPLMPGATMVGPPLSRETWTWPHRQCWIGYLPDGVPNSMDDWLLS